MHWEDQQARWIDFKAQGIKNIEEESTFDDAYGREKWRGIVILTMVLNGQIS